MVHNAFTSSAQELHKSCTAPTDDANSSEDQPACRAEADAERSRGRKPSPTGPPRPRKTSRRSSRSNQKEKKATRRRPQAADPDEKRVPRTMIVRRGATDKRVQELVRELRRVMAPHTAERLKERPGNSLKDFVHAAQPLGVSHLLVLGQQKDQVNLRVARLPGGPTLSFKIRSFSLVREVRAQQKRPFESSSSVRYGSTRRAGQLRQQGEARRSAKGHVRSLVRAY